MANRSDTVLVIRAKDEAQSTLNAVNKALDDLLNSFRDGGSQTAQFARGMAAIDAAMAKISTQANTTEAAFKRVNDAIAGRRGDLAATIAQLNAARDALTRLNSADSIVAAGRDQSGRLAQVKAVSAAIAELETQQRRLTGEIAKMEAGISGGASSLQVMGSAANGMEARIAEARKEIERTTRSLAAQEVQARSAGAVLGRVNAVTGVGRGTATDDGASFEALAEREIAAQKRREQAARDAAEAVQRSVAASTGTNRPAATEDGASFEALARAADAEAAALQRLRAQLNPMVAEEARVAAELQKLIQWRKQGKISADEQRAAEKLLNDELERSRQRINGAQGLDTKGRPSIFGLKPFEIQNLSFQINDIFTQLASGTSLTQTLAQQGGQLLQIFPKVGEALVGAFKSPPVLLLTAAVGGFIAALNTAANAAERLRVIEGILTLTADGAVYQAEVLQGAAKDMRQFGVSAEDALAVVRTAVGAGFNEERIEDFGRTAQNLALVLGIKVPEAAAKLATALQGNFDSIDQLDGQINAFTADQREMIRGLFEQGRAHEAVERANAILSARLEDTAEKMRGPWYDATTKLSSAWKGLWDTLADTAPVQGALTGLTNLAEKTAAVLDLLSGNQTIEQLQASVDRRAEEQRAYLEIVNQNGKPRYATKENARGLPFAERNARDLNRDLDEIDRRRAEARRQATDLRRQDTEAQIKADRDLARSSAERATQEHKITSEADIQARLALVRKKALEDAAKNEPRSSDAARRAYADGEVKIERVKLEKELTEYRKRQAEETERANRAARSMEAQTIRLLKQFEGFRGKAYWDVNAFRVGYGSDTVTRPDGTVRATTSSTRVTEADALRDLERRVKETSDTVKRQIGSDRYGAFTPEQQAALNSIAYNYGSLPKRIIDAVRSGTAQEMAAAVRGLGGDNRGINRDRRNREAAILETPNTELVTSTETIAKEQKDAQAKFNLSLDEEVQKRRLSIDAMQRQRGLIGEALLAEQRRQAVAEAVQQKLDEINRINLERAANNKALITITPDDVKRIEDMARAEFDLANARQAADARRDKVQRPVDELSALRDAIQQQIQFYQETGKASLAKQLEPQLDAVNAKLVDAIARAREFYAALSPEDQAALGITAEQLDIINLKLQSAQNGARQFGYILGISTRDFAQTFASGATSALDGFAQSIASGANAFRSLGDAFRRFAADFLLRIAQMRAEQLLFNAISGFVGGGIGGFRGTGFSQASLDAGQIFHAGGIVGSPDAPTRPVNPSWFRNAARYHTGGVAGLRPGEIPAVLMKGEEVLTRDDPRHIMNGGGGSGRAQDIKIVNAIDSGHMLSEAMSTTEGQRALVNFIRSNKRLINGSLG